MAQMERGEIVVKVKADVDEAVAGLKRLQRVARETVQELREAESLTINGKLDLSGVSTKDLINELAQRDGVWLSDVEHDEQYHVRIYTHQQLTNQQGPKDGLIGWGPARVIISHGYHK